MRGAKVHTSVSTNTNEVIVLPTRAMRAEDKAYAVAFALPINTPGLKLLASPHGSSHKNDFEHPISARHKMMETLTVFDDVFVPKERVFLQGEIDFAGLLALTFVRFHRFTAVSYKLPLLELMAGAGHAIAEANGISRAGHVRDKLTHLAAYHTTVRGLIEHAARTCTYEDGVAVPNTLLTNVAKYHFAHNYHQAVQIVQDLAGGLLVTGPAAEDLTSEATRAYVLKYMGGAKGFDCGEAAAAAEPDQRSDVVGFRRLPGSARSARRRRLRSREAAGLPRVRLQDGRRLRAQARGYLIPVQALCLELRRELDEQLGELLGRFAVHRVRHLRERSVIDRLARERDQLAYSLCLEVRRGAHQVAVGFIDVAEMVRIQHRAFDARQHPRMIAAREDGALPERAPPLRIVFLHPLRDLAVAAEHHRDDRVR